MHDGGKKAIIAALMANLGIALMKFIAFVFTGAYSLLAESIHSFADTSNQMLLLFGANRARKKPSPEHPFGYGPERYFWSFVVALVLFSMGGLFALVEGFEKFRNPHELSSPIWAFIVLGVGIILEGSSFRVAFKQANKFRKSQSIWRYIHTAKNPEIPVVLLEDIGAMLGLVFALVGLTLATITNNARFDALGSMAIGILLVCVAYVLAKEMKSLLIGESVEPAIAKQIREAITSKDDVNAIIHMKTMHLSPDDILLCIKVDINAQTPQEIASSIDAIEKRVRASIDLQAMIYVEPDILRTS